MHRLNDLINLFPLQKETKAKRERNGEKKLYGEMRATTANNIRHNGNVYVELFSVSPLPLPSLLLLWFFLLLLFRSTFILNENQNFLQSCKSFFFAHLCSPKTQFYMTFMSRGLAHSVNTNRFNTEIMKKKSQRNKTTMDKMRNEEEIPGSAREKRKNAELE